jgi:2,3-diketo-5-methylthio-1-phosphopentane phosphatase
MNEFAFISDFDGTLTDRDFYKMVMDTFQESKGKEVFSNWINGEIGVFDFLNTVFSTTKRTEEEFYHAILEIPFDRYAKDFIESIKMSGGDFIILSAGTGYYIERLFNYYGIKDVPIISNKGEYKNGGIHMTADTDSPYYSKSYGIDKSVAVEYYKKQYRKVYYAGDSEPDLRAALKADIAFARNGLQKMLKSREYPFVPFDNFNQVGNYLKEMGVIKVEKHPVT